MSTITGHDKTWNRASIFGSAANTAYALGGGTAANPLTSSTANTNFVDWRTKSTATSGDNRGHYLRHYLSGANGGGECLRAFTTVEAACGTAHGAHISLNFGESGALSGLGVACRATAHIKNAAMTGTGTLAALQAEVYSDGANSDPAALTDLSLIRIVNDGNAAGVAAVDDKANLLSLSGFEVGADNMVAAKTAAAVSHTVRCNIGGATYYLMLSDTQ